MREFENGAFRADARIGIDLATLLKDRVHLVPLSARGRIEGSSTEKSDLHSSRSRETEITSHRLSIKPCFLENFELSKKECLELAEILGDRSCPRGSGYVNISDLAEMEIKIESR